MDSLLKALVEAPAANILILAGLFFVGLAIVGKVSGRLEPDRTGRIWAGIFGGILLLIGLYIIGNDAAKVRQAQVILATAAPTSVPAVALATAPPPAATLTPRPIPTSAPATALPTALPSSSSSQPSIEHTRRDLEVNVLSNGDVTFVDTWEIRFFGGPYTLLRRNIAVVGGTTFTDFHVSENGQEYQENGSGAENTFQLAKQSLNYGLAWNFPAITNGSRTFVFRYTAHQLLGTSSTGLVLRWTYIGSQRDYKVGSVHVVVRLPKTYDPAQVQASATLNNAVAPGGRALDGKTVDFAAGPFNTTDQWIFQVGFPG